MNATKNVALVLIETEKDDLWRTLLLNMSNPLEYV